MNIIRSQVVDAKYDELWQDLPQIMSGLEKKALLIIVSKCAAGSAEDQQLKKMLDAGKLQSADYQVVRLEEGKMIAWHKLRERTEPAVVFLIGVTPAQLGVSALFALNTPNNFDGRKWLATLTIQELEQHADVKKQLWLNGMKPLFVDTVFPPADK